MWSMLRLVFGFFLGGCFAEVDKELGGPSAVLLLGLGEKRPPNPPNEESNEFIRETDDD